MKYKGKITRHIEMCCGHWPQFHDERGLHGDKKQFWNWDWTINFGHKTKIKHLLIWNDDGEVLYDNSWTISHHRSLNISGDFVYPEEVPMQVWGEIMFMNNHLNCELETDEIVEALKNEKS